MLKNPLVRLGITEGRRRGRLLGRLEGRYLGETKLVLRQLIRLLGPISPRHRDAIRKLSLEAIEELGEALLDFKTRSDLSPWLRSHPN